MGAIKDLLASERGLVSIVLILGITVLTALGVISGQTWADYTQWLATAYFASKTVTGVATVIKAPPAQVSAAVGGAQ